MCVVGILLLIDPILPISGQEGYPTSEVPPRLLVTDIHGQYQRMHSTVEYGKDRGFPRNW